MHSKLNLMTVSQLEKGRIQEIRPDPLDLSGFLGLENLISDSLMPDAPAIPKRESPSAKHPFEDQSLVQKLIQFRNQIPTSSRIIRASDS